jgi:hypothetical protein
MDVVKVGGLTVRIAFTPLRGASEARRQKGVSNLMQVLSMMAIPAAVLLTCRYLNVR